MHLPRHTIAKDDPKDLQILVVEDYPTNQQVVLKHLKHKGYQADLSENGKDALTAFCNKQYDLILMDMQMPIMDGYDATREIRQIENRRKLESGNHQGNQGHGIPIIAMTAHAMKGDREKCINAGVDDYLTKPLRRDSFLQVVAKWLEPGTDYFSESNSPDQTIHSDSEPVDVEKRVPTYQTKPFQESPMDFHRALSEFDGDKDFLLEVLNEFIKNIQNQLPKIKQAFVDGAAEVVEMEAHSIKGGAANLTADKLSKIAHELEKAGKSGDLTGHESLIPQLGLEIENIANLGARMACGCNLHPLS